MKHSDKNAIHVLPVDGSDIIDHISSWECQCKPRREDGDEYEVPLFVHNKLKDGYKQ